MYTDFDPSKRIQFAFMILMLVTTSTLGKRQPNAPIVYVFDSATSQIHWRVYKSGVLSGLGHNHVIAVAKPAGKVFLSQTLPESRIEMEINVADLIIDNPTLRSRYGDDFSSEPSADDIAGTHNNMLSKSVLNGTKFPTIKITGTALSGFGVGQTIDLVIQLLDRTISVNVPINVERTANGVIQVHSEFKITHDQLGLKPFRVMMGILQVADEIDFSVRIRAVMSSL
jgi:polyisoprenoid-binding protein YceI